MTKKEALEAVKNIEANVENDDEAHRLEDALRGKFIFDISKSKNRLSEVAKIVLSTNDIDFVRWYE